jgi:16S rRNA C967 or C1407 C5-methylase (RsmB/RsmF family)
MKWSFSEERLAYCIRLQQKIFEDALRFVKRRDEVSLSGGDVNGNAIDSGNGGLGSDFGSTNGNPNSKSSSSSTSRGGRIVYATHSILEEENMAQVRLFCKKYGLVLVREPRHALPQSKGLDGFFCAGMERR